jgi:hypothetical protein
MPIFGDIHQQSNTPAAIHILSQALSANQATRTSSNALTYLVEVVELAIPPEYGPA